MSTKVYMGCWIAKSLLIPIHCPARLCVDCHNQDGQNDKKKTSHCCDGIWNRCTVYIYLDQTRSTDLQLLSQKFRKLKPYAARSVKKSCRKKNPGVLLESKLPLKCATRIDLADVFAKAELIEPFNGAFFKYLAPIVFQVWASSGKWRAWMSISIWPAQPIPLLKILAKDSVSATWCTNNGRMKS